MKIKMLEDELEEIRIRRERLELEDRYRNRRSYYSKIRSSKTSDAKPPTQIQDSKEKDPSQDLSKLEDLHRQILEKEKFITGELEKLKV